MELSDKSVIRKKHTVTVLLAVCRRHVFLRPASRTTSACRIVVASARSPDTATEINLTTASSALLEDKVMYISQVIIESVSEACKSA